MTHTFDNLPFQPADILLPQDCDLSPWSVVACDQYTSQPEYWQRVEERVGRAPSSLRLILPESCLEGPSVETDVMEVNNTMTRYLRENRFRTIPNSMIYVERTLHSGKVRRGLIGMADLEQYNYEPGSASAIRATEGTVMSRIPPRVSVRKNAPVELPHAMLLVDDPEKTLLEPLAEQTEAMELLYDFELMEDGGHLRGWKLNQSHLEQVAQALQVIREKANREQDGLLFAVGDGNHSLAAAKEHYERRKRLTSPEQWPTLPSRHALVELVNLYDPAVEFLPIHRVVFGVEPLKVLDALCRFEPNAVMGFRLDQSLRGQAMCFPYMHSEGEGEVAILSPDRLTYTGELQYFLDHYLSKHPQARVDYIHGEDTARKLAQRPETLVFLLPAIGKETLFPTVIRDGAFPLKSFSVGQANDKRFYLEARKIRV